MPSDGARLQPGADILAEDGVVLSTLVTYPDGVVDNDILTAIEGVSMEQWADDLLLRQLPRPDWRPGMTAGYMVDREEVTLAIAQTLGRYPLLAVVGKDWGALAFALANLLVAAFAFSRKPDDSAIHALLLGSASLLAASTWSIGLQASDFVFGLPFFIYQLTTIIAFGLVWSCVLHFVLVFPRPQSWLEGRRWVLALVYLLPLVLNGAWILYSHQTSSSTLEWLTGLGALTGVVQILYMLLILGAAVMAVRNARDPVSRAQVRWVLFALASALAFGLIVSDIPELLLGQPLLSTNIVAIFGLILPISIVISIFRYQLFDIDVIIRRTTQYALVTAILAVVYFASVVALQWVFTTLTGQSSSLAIVLSTLLIAALFLPLRQRIQRAIDRRFYRSKYDAQRTLERFAATVRDETDLDVLTAELVRVIEETMQPESVTVWLAPLEKGLPTEEFQPGTPGNGNGYETMV